MPPLEFEIPVQLFDAFRSEFGVSPTLAASAPGRVNLIGEHTDYNEGFVLPVAIDRRTWSVISPRSDDRFVCHSLQADDRFDLAIDALTDFKRKGWFSYVAGVASLLRAEGVKIPGVNCLIHSTVPLGAGLSSSAALEVSAAYALLGAAGRSLPVDHLIRLCQKAEWDWAGVSCGIMDQFISARGMSDTALLIDCRTLTSDAIPVHSDLHLVICDTNVPHRLTSSEYNRRRDECGVAVDHFRKLDASITTLRDVSLQLFESHAGELDDVSRRRARHVISENARVHSTADALWYRDHARMGAAVNESHESLRSDYNVSSKELDVMVDICRGVPGVWGARMVGAGFGGSVLALATPDAVEPLTRAILAAYEARTGYTPTVTSCRVGAGASVLRLP